MSRTRAMLVIGAAVALLGVASPSAGASSASAANVLISRGALADLSPGTVDPTDGASGMAVAVSHGGWTRVVMILKDLDAAQAGVVHGAHVHVGPCVAGSGAAAGPHFNATGGSVINESTEVWLDFRVGRSGNAIAWAWVPFVIPAGGANSIVIHAAPTAPNGTAGARLACLPMVV